MFKTRLTTEDYEKIVALANEGNTLIDIANQLSVKVSKQRIKQILLKKGINSFQIRQQKKLTEHAEKMTKKWGSSWDDKHFKKSLIYQTWREKFRAKKHHAKLLGIPFSIDFGDIEFFTHCPMLGLELDYLAPGRQENSPSFDRVDPNKGYEKGNVILISWRANRIKNDGSAEEHRKIADFLDQKKEYR